MARAEFGGSSFDLVLGTYPLGSKVELLKLITGNTRLYVWEDETGSDRYTDLVVDGVSAEFLESGLLGRVPSFLGPDGVTTLWISAGADGARFRFTSQDEAAIQQAREDVEAARDAVLAVPATTDGLMAGRANDDASAFRAALTRNGKKPVALDDLVFNVLDHGAVGDGVTDDLNAIQALVDAVSASGGGTVFFPPKVFFIREAIRCKSRVHFTGVPGSVIRNTKTTGHVFLQAAFLPGYIHGAGFYAPNGAGHIFPSIAIGNVALGAATVTASTPGAVAGVAVGDFVAVRSTSNYVLSSVEIPSQLYFTQVSAKSGDTLTLRDGSPYEITGATIHHLVGQPTDLAGLMMEMVENVSITNLGVDATSPIQGGGAYGFTMTGIRPVNRSRFAALATVNAISHFRIADCVGDWSYCFAEFKLGSSDGLVENNVGTWGAGTVYHPVSFGESAHRIKFDSNRLTIGSGFNDTTKSCCDVNHSQDITITNNRIEVQGAVDSVFAIAGATVAEQNTSDITIAHNTVKTNAGVNRGFQIGSGAVTIGPQNFTVAFNRLTGLLNGTVNEWLNIGLGTDFTVRDNVAPLAYGAKTGAAARGMFITALPGGSAPGSMTTQLVATGWVKFNAQSVQIGRLPFRGALASIRVEVTQAFNSGGTDLLTVGYPGLADAFTAAIDVSAVGVTYIYPGHASAGTRMGKRETTAVRDIYATYTAGGTAPTTGLALITCVFEPFLPPSS